MILSQLWTPPLALSFVTGGCVGAVVVVDVGAAAVDEAEEDGGAGEMDRAAADRCLGAIVGFGFIFGLRS